MVSKLLVILLVYTTALGGAKVRSGAEMSVGYLGGGDHTPENTIGQYYNFQGSGAGRTGNEAFIFIANGGPPAAVQQQTSWTQLSLTTPVYASFWMKLGTILPNANSHIALISNTLVTNYLSIMWLTSGKISLTVDGVGKDTTSGAVATSAWILVKMYSTWTTSGNTNTVIINGETLTDNSNMSAFQPTILGFGWFNAQLNPGKSFQIDDIKLNDASGSYENTWPDDSSGIYYLPVTSDSALGNWTGGSGGTSNLSQALDNDTPQGRDTTLESDGTQIKNSNSTVPNSYIGKIKKINDYVDNQARIVPSTKTIRVAFFVAGHGQHRDVTPILGTVQLLSNPTDTSAIAFLFGDSSDTHGIDVNGGTGDASLEWRRIIGDPHYFPIIDRNLNTIIALTKITSTVHPAEFDQAGMLIEVGEAQANSFQHKVVDW